MPLGPVCVIGDIHGRADLLARFIPLRPTDCKTVFVGDYIDRGEESKLVLETLLQLQSADPENIACLMGNHEKMMLDFLDNPVEKGARWLRNGGLQTLASFGVADISQGSAPEALVVARDHLRAAMPEAMENWLGSLPLSWNSGSLWVVHAAADPALPLEKQSARTLLWGHPGFMAKPRKDGLWVAHGHTVVSQAEARMNHISVDTGAYYTGRLTYALIQPNGSVTFNVC